jgi:hypothetical protein
MTLKLAEKIMAMAADVLYQQLFIEGPPRLFGEASAGS